MDFQTLTYELAQQYVRDNAGFLRESVLNSVAGWLRSRSLSKLASCTTLVNSSNDIVVDELRTLMQVEAFFKKNATFESDGCREAALNSFWRAEKLCRITNRRLDHFYVQRERLAPDLDLIVNRAQKYIHQVLGPFEAFVHRLPEYIRVTTGATRDSSRRNSLPHLKLSRRLGVTPNSLKYTEALGRYYGVRPRYRLVGSNRVEFVPKNWKTDRTIACEPSGTLPLQLAFDEYTKNMLKRFGIDLSDQSRNQGLAKEGSVSGGLATIDLSMASDTLAYNTVAWLLPYDWYKYLSDIRAPLGVVRQEGVNPQTFPYAKFSSMGNGATFALETLIFASLCYAVGSKAFSVYGDDIIIETELAQQLLVALRFFGFKTNEEKSYLEGPFRESCGGNFFEGQDITPVYVRGKPGSKAAWSHLVNTLASVAIPGGALAPVLQRVVKERKLPYVPFSDNSTDGVWVDIHTAYALGLIKSRRQVQFVRRYKPRDANQRVENTATLFLWHLDAHRRKSKYLVGKPLVRSRPPTLNVSYKRARDHWFPPVAATPAHLYWWTDFLTAQ